MRKIFKYLKPHTLIILVCFVLLFLQASSDLSLPNLMSNIVNVGIQQNGIENAAPDVITENNYRLVNVFMADSEKELTNQSYTLVTNSTSDENYEKYVNTYPKLKDENLYILTNKSNMDSLNNAFEHAYVTCIAYFKQGETGEINASTQNLDLSALYQQIPSLEQLSSSTFDEARKSAQNIDHYVADHIAVSINKNFYTDIGMNITSIEVNYIAKTGIGMLIFALISGIAAILVSFLGSRIAAKTASELRHAVFSKVESFSSNEFNKFSTASLITRTTNDITQIQTLIATGIRIVCYAPILGIGGIILALQKSVSMSWVIALGVIVLLGLIAIIFSIAIPKFNKVQKLLDKLNLIMRENLSGIMVIRAFGTQKFEENRFNDSNVDITKNNLFINRLTSCLMPAMMLIMNLSSLLIVWVGSKQISESAMQVGDMMAFMQYSMQIILAFLLISVMFIMVPRAAVSANRIAEVLETELTIKDAPNPKAFNKNNVKGVVEFKNVSFKYGDTADNNVIENISFTALPGQTTAFIGSTGSGKSTLINLIPRFHDVTTGEILIDGTNIKDIAQHDLHEAIGYVSQKGILFSGDIASNLRYGEKNASDEDIEKAAEVAQAMEFINANSKGFKREIAQGGDNVSGGQKQRLAIARALVKKAPIYIFDDSFSALDFKTDAALRKALYKYTANSTILIVAQRVSTIMDAEQIIVLDKGKIVGKGTHKELLKNCETYKEIASSQLSKEELK